MNMMIISLFIVAILIALAFKNCYNTLLGMIETLEHHQQQIHFELEKRFQTFQALLAALSAFMDYEQSPLKEVIGLRARAEAALSIGDEFSRIKAENEISKIANRLPTIFEEYPELKSGKNVLQLEERIKNHENKLSYAKGAYNQKQSQFINKKKAKIEQLLIQAFPEKLNKHFIAWE